MVLGTDNSGGHAFWVTDGAGTLQTSMSWDHSYGTFVELGCLTWKTEPVGGTYFPGICFGFPGSRGHAVGWFQQVPGSMCLGATNIESPLSGAKLYWDFNWSNPVSFTYQKSIYVLGTITPSTGTNCIGIGSGVLDALTTGNTNIFIGNSSGASITTGNANVALGDHALNANVDGGSNIAIGRNALYGNISGNSNTSVGRNSGFNATGSNNTIIGSNAGFNEITGSFNSFLGNFSGSNYTTGSNNIVIGGFAGSIDSGTSVTAVRLSVE
jgi:hypothetical protein